MVAAASSSVATVETQYPGSLANCSANVSRRAASSSTMSIGRLAGIVRPRYRNAPAPCHRNASPCYDASEPLLFHAECVFLLKLSESVDCCRSALQSRCGGSEPQPWFSRSSVVGTIGRIAASGSIGCGVRAETPRQARLPGWPAIRVPRPRSTAESAASRYQCAGDAGLEASRVRRRSVHCESRQRKQLLIAAVVIAPAMEIARTLWAHRLRLYAGRDPLEHQWQTGSQAAILSHRHGRQPRRARR